MEISKHIQQPDPNTLIWRYIDFAKFVSLLERRELFFCLAKNLEDKFEGVFPKELLDLSKPENIKKWKSQVEEARETMALTCWHINANESPTMWNAFLSNRREGIVIQSTVDRLYKSLMMTQHCVLWRGKVSYTPIINEPIRPAEIFFYKRKNFADENEYRIVAKLKSDTHEEEFWRLKKWGGLHLLVNLNTLIDKIYVAPNASDWFFDVINRMRATYKLQASVLPSRLRENPLP